MAPNRRPAAGAGAGAGGMDEALRYNQQLQFCRQLHALQQQLCEDTFLSAELLASLHALGKFSATPASVLHELAATYPEFAAKLVRTIKHHPLRDLHVEQMEGDAVDAVISDAENLACVLQPMYKELQELGKFFVRASNLLADLHQLLIPVTMAKAPQVIEFFMTLFCNTARIVLLMDRVPWRLVVQVYTIVTGTLDGASPPGRTAVCELLERLADPVPYLQELFQPISARVSQVLELAVSAVLDHVASCGVLQASSVFDVTRLGQTQLGITGLSLDKTYSFLQRLDDLRAWALLGFLACPAALGGVNAQPLMAALLRDAFLLPVHGDVVLPLHSLYQQHVTPHLEQLLASLLDSAVDKGAKAAQLADARALVGRCYAAAADGAEAEHAARRRLIARVLHDLHAALEDDAARLPEALQMALAAQAYARSEVLWYFRHVGERLPPPPGPHGAGAKLGLGGQPKGPALAEDGQVVVLIAAMAALYDLLEEHQDVLGGAQLAHMRALLEQQVLPETAAVLATADKNAREIPSSGKERVVPKILVPLIKAVVFPLAELAQAEDCTAPPPAPAHSHAGAPSFGGAAGSVVPDAAARDEPGSGAAEPAAVLADAQQQMVHLTMLLSSRNLWMRPVVLEAPAQDPQYLEAIHRLLELCPFIVCFMSALEASCCLAPLVHYQAKLQALQQHVLQGGSLAAREALSACPSLLKVLHWFEHNPPTVDGGGLCARDYAAEARQLACCLLEEQCGTVALLLTDMAQELAAGLYVTHPAAKAAAARGGSGEPDAAAAADQQRGLAAATALAGAGGAAPVRSRAVALAHALDAIGGVCVASDRLVRPGEYLRAALQQCLLLQLNDLVAAAEVPPVPSVLARMLRDLLWAAAELHEVLGFNVTPELWQVLLNHAQPEWVLPPGSGAAAGAALCPAGGDGGAPADLAAGAGAAFAPAPRMQASSAGRAEPPSPLTTTAASWAGDAAPGGTTGGGAGRSGSDGGGTCGTSGVPMEVFSMVQAYGEWFMQAIVRDVRGLGVMYAPQLRCFTCLAGPVDAVQQRASLPELAALLGVFGPYAAVRLCELTEGVVLDCLGQLDGCLSRWKEQLDPITLAVVRDDACADAVAAASAALADEGTVLTQARQLARCLAFRQLLGEAMAQALGAAFPAVAATVDAVASNAARRAAEGAGRPANASAGEWGGLVAGRHLCDLFDLPRPGLSGVGSPAVADPIVVTALVGSNNYERYKAWFNLPALLGLALQSPTISATSVSLPQHSLANELHGLVHAAKCLALAQQAAANKVLTCGSAFLHPEAPDQAAAMLACFAKVAATTLFSRPDAVSLRTSKQLLLEHLACPQLPPAKLADAWLPACRVRSGLMQAVL